MTKVREDLEWTYGTTCNKVHSALWNFVVKHTWVECENSLGIEHMYYKAVNGWVLEI